MARNSIKTSNNAIDPFQKFSTKLALELVTRDVKVLKYLTVKKVPERILENIKAEKEYSGLKWVECLKKHEVIWENNVGFLIEALEAANRFDLAKEARKYQEQISEELRQRPRTRTELVPNCNPTTDTPHLSDSCLHVFFAAEMGYAAGRTNICKRLINASKRALDIFYDKKEGSANIGLALSKFGNHGEQNTDESNVAVFVEDLKSYLNCRSFHGGIGGTSGIADALSLFVDDVQGKKRLQRQIPKICIMICFISNESFDLEYFRCPDGKDAIRLCNTLAQYAIPLYVIGIDLAGVQACARGAALVTEENHFLSGITLIGGGQYFQVSDINHVEQAIRCIIKENTSIENNMGTVNDIVILERNKEDGDLNVEHLAELLQEQLNLRDCTVDSIMVNNKSLQPISQLVQRVAWADDLDDAISAVKSWKKQNTPKEETFNRTRSSEVRSFASFSSTRQVVTTEMAEDLQPKLVTVKSVNFSSSTSFSSFSTYSSPCGQKRKAAAAELQTHKTTETKRRVENKFPEEPINSRQNGSQSTNIRSSFITLAKGERVGLDVARRMVRRQITRQACYRKIDYRY